MAVANHTESGMESTESITIPDTVSSPRAKLVYVCLQTTGQSTVQELGESLNMKHITLYSILSSLTKSGAIEKAGDSYAVSE